ncbi:hypothetical protein [Azospirillum sp. TSO22-1]|uniref:hypothetical protein n=1 Tax=Azospirillum sp. TSO22-1 TaxID=716789 RepID=UPI000D61259F|nr:hypothetical protein [Azospirillum sp. TSO22-1]PWC52870.1 hypothetical protein TSO221_12685 [Azospirillum sp. TSO22-1]
MTRFANRGIFASAVSTFAVAAALVAGPVALAHAADTATPPAAQPSVSTTTAAPGKSVQTGTSDTAAPAQKTTVQKTEKAGAAPSVAEVPKASDAAKPAAPAKADAAKADATKAAQSKEHTPAPQANEPATTKKP